MRKPSRAGVDGECAQCGSPGAHASIAAVFRGAHACPKPSPSAFRSPPGARRSPSPTASCACPISRSSRSSKATAPGRDIWRASVRVFDAAVQKAYGGKRKIRWMEVFAGEKANKAYNTWLPDETVTACREYLVSIKGPLTTPVGGGIRSLNVALRQMLDLYVCLRPVRWFKGVPSPVQVAREGRHGDLPREHRGHLRGHRVRGGLGRRARSSSSCSSRASRSSSRRSAFPRPPASASSPSPRRAPSGCSAPRSSTPSSTSARA